MPAHKRSEIQIEKDREQIAKWYLQGWSQRKIAAELGLSKRQIAWDLEAIQNQWHKDTAIALDEHKIKVLAELDELKKEAHKAWERSQVDFKATTISGKTVKVEIIDPKTGAMHTEEKLRPTGQVVHTETRPGDPRFLDQVNKCIERRCKLLGLDAPAKQEHTGKDGGPILISDQFKGWTKEDIAKYAITGIKPTNI